MASCIDCRFSRSIDNPIAVACHRYPPRITNVEDVRVTSHFPLLTNSEWCGEWQSGERKDLMKNTKAISRANDDRR